MRRLSLATAPVVQVDLGRADTRTTVGVARGGGGRGERWQRIIHGMQAAAAITDPSDRLIEELVHRLAGVWMLMVNKTTFSPGCAHTL